MRVFELNKKKNIGMRFAQVINYVCINRKEEGNIFFFKNKNKIPLFILVVYSFWL